MHVVLDARVAGEHFPGIGRVARELGRALVREAAARGDTRVSFLVPAGAAGEVDPAAFPADRSIACASSPFSPGWGGEVPRTLARVGADVYHSLFYLLPVGVRVPLVLSCMDVIPLLRPETQPAWKRALYALSYRRAIARADALVAISESTRRDLVARFGVPAGRVAVVPLAADARFAPAASSEVAGLRGRLGLPGSYLLYVGSNKPHKNLSRLLAAYGAVAAARPDVALVVAGAWDPRYDAVRRAAPAGVMFLGPVADADLPALYSGALAFAFPSLYEGFGLPVLEAMACGTPVVTSAISSLPEVAGDAALLVDPASTPAIAAALARLCDDGALRTELSRKALARAAEFSWERAARAYLDVYRAAAGR
jgi:glycosyltransferase involved in cell wall biosynthesis